MTFWLVAAKAGETPESIVAQGWVEKPGEDAHDYTQAGSSREVKRILLADDDSQPPESLEMQTQSIWQFVHDIGAEDIICMVWFKSGRPQGVCFAEVTGHAYAEPLASGLFEHRVPVRWYKEQAGLLRLRPYMHDLARASLWPAPIHHAGFTLALRNHLPLPGNKFAKWMWLIVLVLAIKAFMLATGLWRDVTGI